MDDENKNQTAEVRAESGQVDKKVAEEQVVLFAETNFRNKRVKFGIKTDDRRRHMYLIGKTGMGKSTAMENMIIQDIINGNGVALVDPHGDFAEKILDFIPNERVNDVVYFNPADMDFPIAFNVMEAVGEEHKHLIASGLIGVFKKLWADSWGPRLEYLLRNTILALLDYPGSTLLGTMRMLVDKKYRQKVIDKIQDPVVKSFWVEEYSKYPDKFQVEAIAPIQNKVGQFLSTALIRNVVGQVKSTIDLREIMDNKKILIMNLSKGRIGEDNSALLGAMMITKIQLAAMGRVDIPEEERKDFYLYVDEFQNFATESFANILSEARKYHLNLIIGHQYIEQLEEEVRAAVFGNVGTIMCFRVGSSDAEFLETEFTPYFLPQDLVNLTKFDVYMKLMIDGVASSPFSATTLPPLGGKVFTSNKDKIIKVSRERYAKPREVVEDKISRWSGVAGYDDAGKDKDEYAGSRTTGGDAAKHKTAKSGQGKRKDIYKAECYECGKPTEITFKPDGVRPIYCQDCFKKVREKLMKGQDEQPAIKEAPTPAAEEISLKEALSAKPASFDNKRSNSNQKVQHDRPAPKPFVQNQTDRPKEIKSLNDLIEKKKSNNKPARDNSGPRNFGPGQVVKF